MSLKDKSHDELVQMAKDMALPSSQLAQRWRREVLEKKIQAKIDEGVKLVVEGNEAAGAAILNDVPEDVLAAAGVATVPAEFAVAPPAPVAVDALKPVVIGVDLAKPGSDKTVHTVATATPSATVSIHAASTVDHLVIAGEVAAKLGATIESLDVVDNSLTLRKGAITGSINLLGKTADEIVTSMKRMGF